MYSENVTGVTLRKTNYKKKGIQLTNSGKRLQELRPEEGLSPPNKNSEARQADRIKKLLYQIQATASGVSDVGEW